MAQLIETLRAIAAKWRASKPDHCDGVVLVWEGKAYGWKNALRDPASERPGAYAVDKAGLVFLAEGGNDYNGAKSWVAIDPDDPRQCQAAL